MLDRTFTAVFDGLNSRHGSELEAVRAQHPFDDLRYKYPCLRLDYREAMALLRERGGAKLEAALAEAVDPAVRARLSQRLEALPLHADTDDIGTEDEKLLGEIVAEVYQQDFYIIDKVRRERARERERP